jgi:predicted GIY-YIG superfamily endonuclease
MVGLYILQAADGTVYVGQSKDLAVRLRQHRLANKIDYVRGFVMTREKALASYLDYGEARLYELLKKQSYKLAQSNLSGVLEKRRTILGDTLGAAHIRVADQLVSRFLLHASAPGLALPVWATTAVDVTDDSDFDPPVPNITDSADPVQVPAFSKKAPTTLLVLDEANKPVGNAEIGQSRGADVFADCIIAAGPERVATLGLRLRGQSLVSNSQHSEYASSSQQRGNWYILTHSNTAEKARILSQISAALSLGWTIRVIPRTLKPASLIMKSAGAMELPCAD